MGWSTPAGASLRLGSDNHSGVKNSRLLIVVLVAMIVSAPATAAVSADGRFGGVYANVCALASVVTDLR